MIHDNNAYVIVQEELLSRGFIPDAVSSCFNKAAGGRSVHTVIVPREDVLGPEGLVPKLCAFAEAGRSVEFYRAVTFVILDFESRFEKGGEAFKELSDAYMKIAGSGTVCEFIVMNMETGLTFRIGSGSGIDPSLARALAADASAYAGRAGLMEQSGANGVYRDGADPADGTSFEDGSYFSGEQPGGYLKDYGGRNMIMVYVIIAVCVAVFIWGLWTEFRLGYDVPKTLGIQNNELIAKGQWWRLITPMFLHADIGHLAGNMLSLLYLGRVVTRNHTKTEFLTVYFLSGLAGNVLSFSFLGRNTLSLGASGAIMGVGGMLIYMFTLSRNKRFYRSYGNYLSLVIMVAFNLVYGLVIAGGSINNFAHFGGFATGFLIALLFESAARRKQLREE